MMPSLQGRVLGFWASCLAEEMRLTLPTDAGEAQGVVFLRDTEILSGTLPEDMTRRLSGEAGDGPTDGAAQPPPFPIAVMVAPWVIQKDVMHAKRSTAEPEALYWFHATLAEDGSLTLDENVLPLINRALLAPSREERLVVAELEAWEEARRRKQRWKESWHDFVAEMQTEFLELSGQRIDGWLPEGYRRAKGIVKRADTLTGAEFLRPIHGLCSAFAPDPPPLLARVLAPSAAAVDAAAIDDAVRLGHMGGDFRPNPEQARAIGNVAALPEGGVLAVTGPPGTGKTSFLQSVVADAVVRAFLAGDHPPVVLLTSMNNQAVSNAVEALSPAPASVPVERGRWIQGIAGYGCRYASGEKTREGHQRIVEVARELFRADAPTSRQEFWLAGYAAWSGKRGRSIQDAIKELRRACASTVREGQKLAAALQVLRSLLERGGWEVLDCRRARLEASRRRRQRRCEELVAAALRVHEALAAREADRAKQEVLAREALAGGSLVEKLLSFLPGIKLAAWQRVAAVIRRAGEELPPDTDGKDPQALLAAHVEQLTARTAAWREEHVRPAEIRADVARRRVKSADDCLHRLRSRRQRVLDSAHTAADLAGLSDARHEADQRLVERAADHLDLVLRRRAFGLAMRAREGEFIEAAANDQHDAAWADMGGRQYRLARENFYRALCSVVPCIASTVFIAARRFDHFKDGASHPLRSFVDLMIVDEAGQAPPHRSIPLLGLARRAVIVGDVHQLKPIVTLDQRFGETLAFRSGLSEDDLEEVSRRGLGLHGGSMMRAAITSSNASDSGAAERGILLRRHFRCTASIIAYCNELVYRNRLIPCVADDASPPFPHLGYAHLRSMPQRAGASWRNPIEAAAIARWIGDNERAILKAYGSGEAQTIDKLVAVVTPFAAQKALVRTKVRQLLGNRATAITIDTVHALQGAECPVVIFSPTVTADAASAPPFFDREPNLLNVAVSRARRSFIFFGDMRLCDRSKPTPLGLLGRHLRASEANRIEGVNPFELEPEVQRLANARDHDAFLKRAMGRARERVIIFSFNAWAKPIQDAGIDRLTRQCATRGVDVSFLVGVPRRDGSSLPHALGLLAGCGAAVYTSERVHTKTLVVDDDLILEGSFNWCGTYRDTNGSEERSFALSGSKARPYVEQAVTEFDGLAKTRFAL